MLAAAATAAALSVAGPALADVTVTPNTAVQGTGVNGDFAVTNESPSASITKVTLTLPTDRVIAEVYPLSTENWAPTLTSRKLNPPVEGIHGTLVSQTTATVTWTPVAGKELKPGETAHLRVAMGPLPADDHVVFTVTPTYSDGGTGPAVTGNGAAAFGGTRVAMKLTAVPGAVDQHAQEQLPAADAAPPASDGPGFWSVAGWIAAAIFAAFGVVATLRARREWKQDAPAPASKDSDEKREPVGAGARVTSWSYRDGP